MGLVYRARQQRPDRTVAIKVIAPELAANADFRARFEQESAMAAQIEHPNVIPVYDVGEDDGLLYISMRFVDGVDLGRLLARDGPLESSRAAQLISQVAAALDAAHAHGLVHRDVKPGNILITDGGHVYLTDFGLTRRISDTGGLTATGMFVGTLDYIAPEQIEGRHVDARADIYALGCVVYELLSGTVPFPRDSDVAKLYAHVHDPPPRLPGIPAPLAAAISRAMSKRPADRFASAGDLSRALAAGAVGRTDHGTGRAVASGGAAITDADAPTEVRTGLGTQTGRRGPSRRVLAAAATGLVAAIAAGIAIAATSGGPAPTTTTTTTTTTTVPPKPSNRAILAPAIVAPQVDECQQQLTFGADGSAGPVKCANGDLNVIAWRYYARGQGRLLSLGRFATPEQVLQTMCNDRNGTIPIEQMAYQLAKSYYGWSFGSDPSADYANGCP
jgi:Protein kinase domain